jgi:hypothetical protein
MYVYEGVSAFGPGRGFKVFARSAHVYAGLLHLKSKFKVLPRSTALELTATELFPNIFLVTMASCIP